MTTSRSAELLAILQDHFTSREEGWLWLALFVDNTPGGVVEQIEGHYEKPLDTARGLSRVVNECEVDHAYLALCRKEGRPTEADRELWRELVRLVPRTTLVDLVVFNQKLAWSMRAEDAAAAAAQ